MWEWGFMLANSAFINLVRSMPDKRARWLCTGAMATRVLL